MEQDLRNQILMDTIQQNREVLDEIDRMVEDKSVSSQALIDKMSFVAKNYSLLGELQPRIRAAFGTVGVQVAGRCDAYYAKQFLILVKERFQNSSPVIYEELMRTFF